MNDAKAFIKFDDIGAFDTWNAEAAAKVHAAPGVNYSTAIMRLTPADGSCVATFVIAHDVWDGPSLTMAQVEPLGYFDDDDPE